MSKLSGVEVYAPNDILITDGKGWYGIGKDRFRTKKKFEIFLPKKYKYISSQEYNERDVVKEKEKIVRYLNSFKPVLFTTARVYDEIEKQYINSICDNVYFDGKYEWSGKELYYFEKYDMPLNKEFINYVLDKYHLQ